MREIKFSRIGEDMFKKIPIASLIEPPEEGFTHVMSNRWWCVVDECVLLYREHSWQCNSNKAIAEKVATCKGYPKAEVRFIKRLFVPHNCNDYI